MLMLFSRSLILFVSLLTLSSASLYAMEEDRQENRTSLVPVSKTQESLYWEGEGPSPLIELPKEFWEVTIKRDGLSLYDCINLSKTNRFFHQKIRNFLEPYQNVILETQRFVSKKHASPGLSMADVLRSLVTLREVFGEDTPFTKAMGVGYLSVFQKQLVTSLQLWDPHYLNPENHITLQSKERGKVWEYSILIRALDSFFEKPFHSEFSKLLAYAGGFNLISQKRFASVPQEKSFNFNIPYNSFPNSENFFPMLLDDYVLDHNFSLLPLVQLPDAASEIAFRLLNMKECVSKETYTLDFQPVITTLLNANKENLAECLYKKLESLNIPLKDPWVELIRRRREVSLHAKEHEDSEKYFQQIHALVSSNLESFPLNDSFIDLDMLARLKSDTLDIVRPSTYAEMVWEQKKQRAIRDKGSMEWFVLRNRLSSIKARNKEQMEGVIRALSKRIGFRYVPGFGERVIFRELFLSGLTVLDLEDCKMSLTLSHVSARQELRNLIQMIQLPDVERLAA